jgi:hypothetical protein
MSFQCEDCFTGIQALLMNRPVQQALMLEELRKSVLEFTENYKHPLLEATGPTVQLTQDVYVYSPDFFMNAPDAGLDVSMVNSFFIFESYNGPPSPSSTLTNSGYNLKYRSIDAVEVLMNIPGIPVYWSRNNNQIYLGSIPDNSYYLYMRYQREHPLANTVNGFTSTTQILMADTWQEILEYACAMRVAPKVNLADKKTELHTSLYGDTKFQSSSGIEGAPGLIFQRTSQRNRDQATTTRRLRIRMGRV